MLIYNFFFCSTFLDAPLRNSPPPHPVTNATSTVPPTCSSLSFPPAQSVAPRPNQNLNPSPFLLHNALFSLFIHPFCTSFLSQLSRWFRFSCASFCYEPNSFQRFCSGLIHLRRRCLRVAQASSAGVRLVSSSSVLESVSARLLCIWIRLLQWVCRNTRIGDGLIFIHA